MFGECLNDFYHCVSFGDWYKGTLDVIKVLLLHRHLSNRINVFPQAVTESCMVKKRMKELMTDMEKVTKDREKVREDCDMFREERDAARRERHEAIIHRDKILRECFEAKQRNESFKGDSKEGETLRKQFDALSKELANALSEAEVSKKRRDWSFSERDKMVKVSSSCEGFKRNLSTLLES